MPPKHAEEIEILRKLSAAEQDIARDLPEKVRVWQNEEDALRRAELAAEADRTGAWRQHVEALE